MNSLGEYKTAIENDDLETLKSILKDGRERKEKSIELYAEHNKRK